MSKYIDEKEGQIDFYTTFLPAVDSNLEIDDVIKDNNDGVLNGNLLEFKLKLDDLNKALYQSIKYLSARRIKGEPVPKNILLVDLFSDTAYLYDSGDYITEIEKVYYKSASINNSGFSGGECKREFKYKNNQLDAAALINLLKSKEYTKINIDENCIVGWATTFYATNKKVRKEDFLGDNSGKHVTIGEIRNPTVFKDYIYPYKGKTNIKFQYLMDKLNDFIQKKDLGAFYTPLPYAKKSHELLREAIKRVPEGNDYIILDRCAGSGNLERELSDDELSHCVLSTIEYYEYKVMQELLGSKVRYIVPPIETEDTFLSGLVRGADALSKEYLDNPIIKQYIENPKCTIILFENPPYADTTSIEHQKRKAGKDSSLWKKSFIVQEMKKEIKGTATNDLGNAFIWSGFKYYLRYTTDSYIVYSPVKYWKANNLINKHFAKGFAFNRKHFHATRPSCVMVAYWQNVDEQIEEFNIEAFDIDESGELKKYEKSLPVKKIHDYYSKVYFDKRIFPNDREGSILCEKNGYEKTTTNSISLNPIFNDNIIAYMAVYSSGFNNPDNMSSLLRCGRYDGHGFYLREDNFLEKLPMFAASRYITYNPSWTECDRIMKSGDGAKKFSKDINKENVKQWLYKCLLFTTLELQNHCLSFIGSDNKYYNNELCLDDTHGLTVACKAITNLNLNSDEKQLLDQWKKLLLLAKKTKEYNPELTYGVYQIFSEIDTYFKDDNGDIHWNNLELHSALKTLKEMIKSYYNKEIVPLLFEYSFLK